MNDQPVLDPEAMDALKSINPDDGGEFLKELITIFLHDTPQRITELRSAVVARDASTASRAAHSMKGSAGNFGAARFADINRDLEARGRAGQWAEIEARLPELDAEFARVKHALERELR